MTAVGSITYIMIHNVSDYVEEIFNSMLGADEKKLHAARDALVKMTPAPMNTMLEKQPKEEAIQKHFQRKEKDVINVPPTGENNYISF